MWKGALLLEMKPAQIWGDCLEGILSNWPQPLKHMLSCSIHDAVDEIRRFKAF
jgi:hypothetical protein